MAKDNAKFTGKNRLDIEARRYSFLVYDYFDLYRKNGWGKLFGRYYYPAMIAICCDKDEKMIRGSFSDKGSVEEYKLTGMLNEMAVDFNNGQPIIDKEAFREKSLNKYPIGQCAEQHATNELLFCEKASIRCLTSKQMCISASQLDHRQVRCLIIVRIVRNCLIFDLECHDALAP